MDAARRSAEELLASAAGASIIVQRLQGFTRWVGAGRGLTQTGRIKLADAKALVEQLQTGDEIDPRIGDRVFRTTTSEELHGLTLTMAGRGRPDWSG